MLFLNLTKATEDLVKYFGSEIFSDFQNNNIELGYTLTKIGEK